MMKANQSWIYQQEPAQLSPSLIHMRSMLPYAKPITFPSCINPCVSTPCFAFPGLPMSALPELRTVQANGGDPDMYPCLPSLEKISLPIPDPYFKEHHPSFAPQFVMNPTPNELTGSAQKGFVIFDHSRNQTQMFLSPHNPTSVKQFIDTLNFPFARQLFGKPITQNVSNETCIGEGSEVHEDTEEINALLYSDDEDGEYDEYDEDHHNHHDDHDNDDDEVTSKAPSPFSLKRSNDSREEVEDNSEDLGAFYDGSMKRKKLLDGGHKKSFVQAAFTSVELDKSCNNESDAESCCVSPCARTKKTHGKDTSSFQDTKQSKKVQIRKTLKVLKSIIPCSNYEEDPLLIIEEAINQLKLLKVKAKALGVL